MTKTEAMELFGGRIELAVALTVTPSRISQWPEKLKTDQADRVLGAAIRTGRLQLAKVA